MLVSPLRISFLKTVVLTNDYSYCRLFVAMGFLFVFVLFFKAKHPFELQQAAVYVVVHTFKLRTWEEDAEKELL